MFIIDKTNHTSWVFPAGEVGVQLDMTKLPEDKNTSMLVTMGSGLSDEIMRVLMVSEALDSAGYHNQHLYAPYMPYGRQDRVTTSGTPFSLFHFAGMINEAYFQSVTTIDPHSPVTEELFLDMHAYSQAGILNSLFQSQDDGNTVPFLDYFTAIPTDQWLAVAPDEGAMVRTTESAEALGIPTDQVRYATKVRDPATGEITGMTLSGDVTGKHVIVLDDICDGGRTFIELAKHLEGAASKTLLVSHGIFSKGIEVLFDYYDYVFAFDTLDRTQLNATREFPPNALIPVMHLIFDGITPA